MDLQKTLPENDTLVIEIVFNGEVIKNDDNTPMTVEVYLPHSKEYRRVRHEQADVLIERKTDRLKSSEAEELGLDFLAKTTKTWNITYGGSQPKFSVKKAKEIYTALPWLPDFIAEEVEKQKGFTKA